MYFYASYWIGWLIRLNVVVGLPYFPNLAFSLQSDLAVILLLPFPAVWNSAAVEVKAQGNADHQEHTNHCENADQHDLHRCQEGPLKPILE